MFTWEPLLDILSAIPVPTSAFVLVRKQYGSYGSGRFPIQATLAAVLTHRHCSLIWPAICSHVADALARCETKFGAVFALIREVVFPPTDQRYLYGNHPRPQQPVLSPSDWLDIQLQQLGRRRRGLTSFRQHLWRLSPPKRTCFKITFGRSSFAEADEAGNPQVLQAAVSALLKLTGLRKAPKHVLQAVTPLINKYVDGWARQETKKMEETLEAHGESLQQAQRDHLAATATGIRNDVVVWEGIKRENLEGGGA